MKSKMKSKIKSLIYFLTFSAVIVLSTGSLNAARRDPSTIPAAEVLAKLAQRDSYYQEANRMHAYYASQGAADFGLSMYLYYRAFGDRANYEATGDTPLAERQFYRGLGWFYFVYLGYQPGQYGVYYCYLYNGYADYLYYLESGDTDSANAVYAYWLSNAVEALNNRGS